MRQIYSSDVEDCCAEIPLIIQLVSIVLYNTVLMAMFTRCSLLTSHLKYKQKSFKLMHGDVGMHHAKNRGNKRVLLSRILHNDA